MQCRGYCHSSDIWDTLILVLALPFTVSVALPCLVFCNITMMPGGASGKEPACQCRRHKRYGFDSFGSEALLEEGMATNSSILAWRIPMDRGIWWATVHRVVKSRT